MWILKAQLGKNSWHASCPVYNLILTRRWPYKNLWTMDYLLHCCECESWNQTKNRRERDRDEYFSLLFLCLADCTMYVYMEYVFLFSSYFPIFIEGIFYGTIVYSWGLDAPPFCVYKKYISIKGNIGRNILLCTICADIHIWECKLQNPTWIFFSKDWLYSLI